MSVRFASLALAAAGCVAAVHAQEPPPTDVQTPQPYDKTVDVPPPPAETPPPIEEPSGKTKLEQVVVTASYRQQNIQDVTGSAQAFSGRGLDREGANQMKDYLLQVPSVSLKKSGNGKVDLSMRGISNGNASDLGYAGGNPTVGVYLDDVAIQGSGVFPDLNIYDLRRVEVLKGPQGTLYGEGAMGGAIKMVTMPADPNKWSFHTQGMISDMESGDLSHEERLAINVPLISDRLGLRVVGTNRWNTGFVDYYNLNRPDADDERMRSGRATLGLNATDKLRLEYMYLYDYDRRYQFGVVDSESGRETLSNGNQEPQFAFTRFGIHSFTARWQLPFANLTAVSALYNTYRDSIRRTPVLQTILENGFGNLPAPPPNVFAVAYTQVKTDLDSFSQELRLVSFGGERLDWIGGLFFRTRGQTFDEQKYEESVPQDPTGFFHQVLTLLGAGNFDLLDPKQEDGFGEEKFKMYAGYGELTWNAIPGTLAITGGARAFSEDISFFIDTQFYGVEAALFATDPASPGNSRVFFSQELKTNGVLPKLSASWKFNQDHMAYAEVVRGFRSGAVNIYSALQSGPPIIRPDYVWNYEIGTKSTWFDGSLVTNLAAYRIDWHDVQGTVLGTAHLGAATIDFAHLDNAGDAVVYGVEGSIQAMPVDRLVILLNAGYNDGRVTKPTPESHVPEGSPLPNSPRITGGATINYSAPLFFGLVGETSVGYTWTDRQYMTFHIESIDSSPPPTTGVKVSDPIEGFPVGGYGLMRGSIGISRGHARLQFFGDNLLDRRALTGISAPTPQYPVLTPRVIGLRVSYDY
jgi:outer membrane receptor protein involved in Fe transport